MALKMMERQASAHLITLLFLTTSFTPPSLTQSTTNPCRLTAPPNVYLSPGLDYQKVAPIPCVPSTGTISALMIFIDFPDAPASSSETPTDVYSFLIPDAKVWYNTSSYGKLSLNVTANTTRGFIRMPKRSDAYNWARGLTAELHRSYINDAIQSYTRTYGQIWNGWDVLYIVPPRSAKAISFSPTYMNAVSTIAKKTITIGHDAYTDWKSKVINHETGHAMCLPDLYPESGATGLYVGGWDIMGYINGPAPDYFAWNKWKLGWISDDQVRCVDLAGEGGSETRSIVFSMSALEVDDNEVKTVVVRRNSTTVMVAELRTREGVDGKVCGTGVLLYTVSVTTATGKGPIRVVDVDPSGKGCNGDRLNDKVLRMDGVREFEVSGWGVKIVLLGMDGKWAAIQVVVL